MPSAALVLPAFRAIGPTHMTSGGTPNSGKVNAFAVNPNNPKTIYLAGGRGTGLESYSSAGIYRTTNGGASWQPMTNGLIDPSGATASVVNALWLDPKRPSVLLAATQYGGLFRSVNGGSSWRNVYATTQASQLAAYGNAVFAATASGILRSQNDGATWRIAFAGAAQPTAFGVAQGASGNALYAGMTDGSIYRFESNAWSKVGKLPYDAHTGTAGSTPAVHQIAVDPFAPATLYASTNDGSWDQDLHASTDGGHTWNTVLQGQYANLGLGTQAIAFSQTFPHRLYVGADGGAYFIAGDGSASPTPYQAANLSVIDIRNLWVSANGADDACWIASDQGLDYEPTCSTFARPSNDNVVSSSVAIGLARHVAISPNGRTVFVSLQDFDSHVTFNGGQTWQEQQSLYEDGFVAFRPGDPSICYAYDEASGLSVSTNGCQSFSTMQSAVVPSRLMPNPLAFDPKNPLLMYLLSGPIAAPGLSGPIGAYETTDGGNTIHKLAWPFVHAGSIEVDPSNGKHIIVSDLSNGRSSISFSANSGQSWTKSTGVPASAFWYTITISPANGQLVLASSVDASNNVYVLRSKNGGRSFTKTQIVANAPLIAGRIGGRRKHAPPAAFLYSPVRDIAFNQDVKRGTPDVALTTLRGAFISSDDGSTWKRLDTHLIPHSFWDARWHNGYLYLASDGQGVLRSQTQVQSP